MILTCFFTLLCLKLSVKSLDKLLANFVHCPLYGNVYAKVKTQENTIKGSEIDIDSLLHIADM